jgi:hypothetical protein
MEARKEGTVTLQRAMASKWMRLTLDGSWKPVGEGATPGRVARFTVRDSWTNEPYKDGGAVRTGCGELDSHQTPFNS